MIEWQWRGVTLRLSIWFPLAAVVLLSLDPTHTTELCLTASLLHEMGHALAMFAVHDRPKRITMGFFGMRVERAQLHRMSYRAACTVSLAGPFVNVLGFTLYLLLGIPGAAAVHALIGGFNLLPIRSLDGGEALYTVLCMRYEEEQADKVLTVISLLTVIPLSVLGMWLFWGSRYNFSLLAVSAYLILLIFIEHKH